MISLSIDPDMTFFDIVNLLIEANFIENANCILSYRGSQCIPDSKLGEIGYNVNYFIEVIELDSLIEPSETENLTDLIGLLMGSQPQIDESFEAHLNLLLALNYNVDDAIAALENSGNNYEQALDFLDNLSSASLMNAAPQFLPSSLKRVFYGGKLREIPGFQNFEHPSPDNSMVEIYDVIGRIPSEDHNILIAALRNANPQLSENVDMNRNPMLSMLGLPENFFYQYLLSSSSSEEYSEEQQQEEEEVTELSNEDIASIERLQSLGFSRITARRAYLSCERDEERAARVLRSLLSHNTGGAAA